MSLVVGMLLGSMMASAGSSRSRYRSSYDDTSASDWKRDAALNKFRDYAKIRAKDAKKYVVDQFHESINIDELTDSIMNLESINDAVVDFMSIVLNKSVEEIEELMKQDPNLLTKILSSLRSKIYDEISSSDRRQIENLFDIDESELDKIEHTIYSYYYDKFKPELDALRDQSDVDKIDFSIKDDVGTLASEKLSSYINVEKFNKSILKKVFYDRSLELTIYKVISESNIQ